MARTVLYVTCRQRWWVPFYLKAAIAFLWCFAWGMDDDDIDGFIESTSRFVAVHGFRYETEAREP